MPLPFRFLTPAVFAFFRPLQFWVLTTQPLFLPFLFFPVSPHSSSQVLAFRLSASSLSPSVPPGFPCFPSGSQYSAFLLVSFHPSLFLLPQPLLTGARFSSASLSFRFFSAFFPSVLSRSLPVPTTQPSVSSFPFPCLPSRWFLRFLFPVLFRLSASFPGSWYSALLQFLSPALCFASQRLPQRLRLLPFGFRLCPLSFRLRFWLLGWVIHPEN